MPRILIESTLNQTIQKTINMHANHSADYIFFLDTGSLIDVRIGKTIINTKTTETGRWYHLNAMYFPVFDNITGKYTGSQCNNLFISSDRLQSNTRGFHQEEIRSHYQIQAAVLAGDPI